MKTICVVTGTRAEFGFFTPLLHEIHNDPKLELKLIVTGMHLSPEFGLTYKEIEKIFKIDKKIEILLSSDTAIGVSKSMGLAQISFCEAYEELKPDLVLIAGDRFEIFAAAAAAMITNYPIAHLSGGELTEGAIDESIRHAITKMSHLHFTATEEYRRRVIQLGEHPERVFNVGEAGLDNIKQLPLLDREAFETSIGFQLGEKNILVTFQPVTLECGSAKRQFQNILDAFDELKGIRIIFTKANADTDGRIINKMIDNYVKHKENCIAFISMGQLRYLSALQFVDVVVGNSSSGIVEAPSFKTATINIGNRQKGRTQADSTVNVPPVKDAILKAFDRILSPTFQKSLQSVQNPYEQKNTSVRIKEILKEVDLKNILKKQFYDLECIKETTL